MNMSSKVRTCLWFDNNGEEAANYYVSLLPDSYIETKSYPNDDGVTLVVEFTLAGVPFMTLNGGPNFTHSHAASISVLTEDQDETDKLYASIVANGGQESMCGWAIDRFGVSWQIIPAVLPEMMMSDDKQAANRAREAMLEMKKINIKALERAYAGSDETGYK